jgi:PBP1b-binding outer membrane lipoprotein LpoB
MKRLAVALLVASMFMVGCGSEKKPEKKEPVKTPASDKDKK